MRYRRLIGDEAVRGPMTIGRTAFISLTGTVVAHESGEIISWGRINEVLILIYFMIYGRVHDYFIMKQFFSNMKSSKPCHNNGYKSVHGYKQF